MRPGVRLGIDVGSVRVGVAACDAGGILAYPVATLPRPDDPTQTRHALTPADVKPADVTPAHGPESQPARAAADEEAAPTDLARIRDYVRDLEVIEVVVGLPRSLDGGEGPAAHAARGYAQSIARVCAPVPVRLVDERLTTVDAHRGLRESGVSGRGQRRVVDQAAAVLILQGALDAERVTGSPPGQPAVTTRRKPRRKG
jgi:putative Holliday junction resolvase